MTPSKVTMMDCLGLVTLQCKKDMQQQMFRERRRKMREPSISPVELEDYDDDFNALIGSEPLRPLPPVALEGEENSKEKLKFMLSLRLSAMPPEQKKEKEELRQVCEQMRRRRAEKAFAKKRRRLEKEQQELLEALNHGCSSRKKKRQCEDTTPIPTPTTTTTTTPITLRPPDAAVVEPLGMTLSQLQEQRHLAAAATAARLEHDKQQRLNHTYSGGRGAGEGSRTVIFPGGGGPRQLSREFAEQFHESVLQSTRQKEHLQKLGHLGHHNDTSVTTGKPAPLNHHLPPSNSSMASPSGESTVPFAWPGIEKVLESYMHHRREQQAEKRVLIDRCYQLQTQNKELNNEADSLRERVKVLTEEQRRQAAQREQLEDTISSLKKCLRLPR